ncbi:Leucine Rich repeats (2 copies) [compost metagenome]
MPLLAGEQESLDLSHNKIAFDLSNIPALGPNLKALNLTGNPIAPEAIAELVRRYPHVVFDHDTLRVHPAISSRLSST